MLIVRNLWRRVSDVGFKETIGGMPNPGLLGEDTRREDVQCLPLMVEPAVEVQSQEAGEVP